MKLQYKCAACDVSFESSQKLSSHYNREHNLTGKEYYDLYLKKPDEGLCLLCGKPTKLHNNTLGYLKFCCFKHSSEYNKLKHKHRGERSLRKQEIIKNGKFECKICGNRCNCLGSHIVQVHHISCKDYYDTYLKKPGEGICANPNCNNVTTFRGIMKGGYLKYCSCYCVQNDEKIILKKKETSIKLHGTPNYRNGEQAKKTRAQHLADGTIKIQETTQSAAETEIIKYISLYYTNEIIHGDRTILDGYELDIWLPNIKVGIEYDGEFWHADPRRYKATDIVRNDITAQEIWNKDKNKDLLCESKGIHLMRIKEYDYKHNKAEVLMNLYKYIMNYSKEVTYGTEF